MKNKKPMLNEHLLTPCGTNYLVFAKRKISTRGIQPGTLKIIGTNPLHWEVKANILGWQVSNEEGNRNILITKEEALAIADIQQKFMRSPIGELP